MPRTANVQDAHCDERKNAQNNQRNMPIGMKGKVPTTANVRRVHCKGGKCLERPKCNMPWQRSHANMHMTQLSPIIVWHGNAAFTNIRFWGHVVSVVLFFNNMSLNMISRKQINKKCVVAHARCVSPATPKMFPIFFQCHFRERHACVELITL